MIAEQRRTGNTLAEQQWRLIGRLEQERLEQGRQGRQGRQERQERAAQSDRIWEAVYEAVFREVAASPDARLVDVLADGGKLIRREFGTRNPVPSIASWCRWVAQGQDDF